MLTIENVSTCGWREAIRGMRNPMNSWARSDTVYDEEDRMEEIGENDLGLMKRLVEAGSDHRKFLRMIVVYMDITAPLYWWKEYDTYKVGTVANSCSTMHKIADKPFTRDDFSHDHFEGIPGSYSWLDCTISMLEYWRQEYLASNGKNKTAWWQMIQMLPTSYNQRRTVMVNYEVLRNIYHARKNHKLDEWHTMCGGIENMPYFEELIQ